MIRVTLTTICGTDVHILRGEYPVKPGLIVGHEPVGVIEEIGAGVVGYERGDRVIVGAITPCGQCRACLSGSPSQCGHMGDGHEAIGGWRFGNTINGCQAEYVLVPNAQANLAKIPDGLSDEDVVLCPDIMSTGFSASERAGVRLGDAVVVFAQGPIGLCATAGAKMSGASLVIGVDKVPARLAMAKRMGADVVLNYEEQDVVAEIRKLTGGGADVAIEALGPQVNVDVLLLAPGRDPRKPRRVLGASSRCRMTPSLPASGTTRSVTTLVPSGGKERMERLMRMVETRRSDPTPLITHRFTLDEIAQAYDTFSNRRDGVVKVAIRP